jgi:hypothetical protein
MYLPTGPDDIRFAEEHELATGDELEQDSYPSLTNISAIHFYNFVPVPEERRRPEFLFIPFDPKDGRKKNEYVEVFLADWNNLWEAGQLRQRFDFRHWPRRLKWLRRFEDENIYLLPDPRQPRYQAYAPLFHLLPRRTLQRFGLPLLKRGIWPPSMHPHWRHVLLPEDFEGKLARAFAHHVWPLLVSGSSQGAFTQKHPLVLLSHNLDFWLPFAYQVAEERLKAFGRIPCDTAKEEERLATLRTRVPAGVQAERPVYGGHLWCGEQEAWEATEDLVEVADQQGRLRSLIDAVRSHAVEDDFSPCWSYAREDFERKLYHKRSKVRITFVQLNDTLPVHGPASQFTDDLLWEDFFTVLDAKEKRVTVCLRNGATRVGDISKALGYANHSPVSRTLERVREKARRYFGLDS